MILGKDVQRLKAFFPIVTTLLEILTFAKEIQAKKAFSPILETLLGIAILVKEVQPEYLQPIITQYFIDNKSEIWLLFLIAHSKR